MSIPVSNVYSHPHSSFRLTTPGCPPPEKLVLINSAAAMNSILHYRYRVPKPFASYFPSETSPLALDLISKMLQFHPDDRISVESALEHPYLAEYHIQMPEPVCQDLFNFEFEKVNYDLSSEDVQLLMYEEMLLYRPSATQFPRDADQANIIDMAGNITSHIITEHSALCCTVLCCEDTFTPDSHTAL
jgi:serine/threonine protein kinase